MKLSVGARVRTMRELLGWNQSHLAQVAGVGFRTIQRIESEATTPRLETLMALAAAFKADVSQLLNGLAHGDLLELVDACTCPCCASPLVERVFVEHEYGDCEMETFECGSMRGWKDRPCPKDPSFPAFEDYELECQEDDGLYWCNAGGLTEFAKAVDLARGVGETREEAEGRVRALVRASYLAARFGYNSAGYIACGS